MGTSVSATNKTDLHNITEILLKVALNTINHKPTTKTEISLGERELRLYSFENDNIPSSIRNQL